MSIHYFLILLRFLICYVSICNFLKYSFEFCNTLQDEKNILLDIDSYSTPYFQNRYLFVS